MNAEQRGKATSQNGRFGRWPILVGLAVVLLGLAGCGGPSCPHGIILTAVQQSSPNVGPCQAKPGESPEQLKSRVLTVYTATSPRGTLRVPLRCGDAGMGYTHILGESEDHGDPLHDPVFDGELAVTLRDGGYRMQANGNPRWTRRYSQDESACHRGAWGFRVIAALSLVPSDGMALGIVSAFYLSSPPAEFP